MKELKSKELVEIVENKDFIIDARPTSLFSDGFVQGAINIVLNENFEARSDFFSKSEPTIYIILQKEDFDKINSLSDEFKSRITGIHYGNIEDWQENAVPIDLIISVDPYELKLDITHDEKAIVIDVRAKVQYEDEHIVGAVNVQLKDFADAAQIGMLDEKHNLYLHCNGGTSSVLVSSILKRNGFHNIRNIEGGLRGVKKDGNIPLKTDNKKSQN